MKRNCAALLCALAVLGGGSLARAAAVVWEDAVTITGVDDVNTEGTLVFSRNLYLSYTDPQSYVKGVHFGYNNPAWSVGFSEPDGLQAAGGFSSSQTFDGPEGPNYALLLNGTRFIDAPLPLTFSNLTVGQEYLLQLWVSDYRPYPNDRTQSVSADGHTNINVNPMAYLDSDGPIHGQYIIGRWTADSDAITFTINPGLDGWAQYNMLQVRAVPEPSSLTLLCLAGVGLLCFPRKRLRAAAR